MPERFGTQFDRVVGGSEQEKTDGMAEFEEYASDASHDLGTNELLKEAELEKTEGDLELIARTEAGVDDMVRAWGGSPAPMLPEKVHVVEPGAVLAGSRGKMRGGYHNPYMQMIVVERYPSDIAFQQAVAHELFHKKSYKSARVHESVEAPDADPGSPALGDAELYRSGLQLFDRKDRSVEVGSERVYFSHLEEAIVAESAHKLLMRETAKDPRHSEAFASARAVEGAMRAWIGRESDPAVLERLERLCGRLPHLLALDGPENADLAEALAEQSSASGAIGYFMGALTRMRERGQVIYEDRVDEIGWMNQLFDDLVARSGGAIASRDEAFDLFARANYSGNYLPLARTLEPILGPGGLRIIAESFARQAGGSEDKE